MIRDVETVLCRDDAQPWYRLIHFWLAFTRIGKPLANQKTKQNSPEPAHCLLYNNEVLPTIKHHFQSYLENDQKVLDSHSGPFVPYLCSLEHGQHGKPLACESAHWKLES